MLIAPPPNIAGMISGLSDPSQPKLKNITYNGICKTVPGIIIVESTQEKKNSLPFHCKRENAYAQSEADTGTSTMLHPTTFKVFHVYRR